MLFVEGTMNYMAPEVIKLALLNPGNQTFRGSERPSGFRYYIEEDKAKDAVKPYTHKIDLWSYGMMVYELLTLQLPYANLPVAEASSMIERGVRPPLPPSKDSFLTPEMIEKCKSLVEIFEKCAVLDPDGRISAEEILKLLSS